MVPYNPQNFLIITRGKLITSPTYLFGQYEDEWWRENDEWRKNICKDPFFLLIESEFHDISLLEHKYIEKLY